ncbi:MAG: DUF416 family protein [Cyanobacteria bacterium P01_A01_bin.84]
MKLEYGYEDAEIDLVVSEVKKNPLLHQIAFAASICERLLPNYLIFAKEMNWETYPILRKALDEVWMILKGDSIDSIRLNQLLNDCKKVIPHGHDNDSGYVVEAQYTASSIYHLIDMCLQQEPAALKMLVNVTYNTLYQYLDWQMEAAEDMAEEETNDDWSKKTLKEQAQIIASHPFVAREMKKENEDLQLLKETPNLTPEFVRQFCNSALEYTNGKSLIDLG